MKTEDSLFQQNLRYMILDQIAAEQNISARVIEAMKKTPRHFFVEDYQQEAAYEDKPLPIISGQTISQITTVAIQTDLLKAKKGDRVLEIGSGSGYQAAILYAMGCEVFSIERLKTVHQLAKKNLAKLKIDSKITLIHGDGYKGLPEKAPFDAIVVTCGATEIPENLKKQLAIGGRMVIPVGTKLQEMKVVEKTDEETYEISNAGYFSFVPMLKGKTE